MWEHSTCLKGLKDYTFNAKQTFWEKMIQENLSGVVTAISLIKVMKPESH